MAAAEQFPESFYCPLTHEVMKDPVVDPEGNSYERSAIEAWLKRERTSPITRTPLLPTNLAPNRALRDAIEARLKEHGGAAPPPAPVAVVQMVPSRQQQDDNNNSSSSSNNNKVQLKVTASKIAKKDDEYYVLASVVPPARPPQGSTRPPLDVCCVIDVSGSMGEEAKMKKIDGVRESHGLSLLDVVKHAVKTIGHSLHPTDRLSIVAYSTTARVLTSLTYMDDAGKKEVDDEMAKLFPEDTTNLWDGLQKGLELLRKDTKPGRVCSLLLLTDGLPNVSPPRGEVAMFRKYIDQHQQLPCSVSTFGFGFSINSVLLKDIAVLGNGIFSFIPDSSFVGTVFVNAVSNLLVTMATNVTIGFEHQNNTKIVSVLGNHHVDNTSWGALVHISALQYGQTLDVVLKMKIPNTLADGAPYVGATLKFDQWNAPQQAAVSVDAADRRGGDAEVRVQTSRLLVVEGIARILEVQGNPAQAKAIIAEMTAALKDGADPREKAMLEDVSGQVTEAVDAKFYKRWGQHYLPSLARAYLLQQTNNFMDPGIQCFGGELFRELRDVIEDIFVKLPPPVPSRAPATNSYSSYSYSNKASAAPAPAAAAPAPVFDMSDYYDYGHGGCFDGSCLVRMADGSVKMVKDIAKGDQVATLNGDSANKVVCSVKILSQDDQTELVEMEGGLLVTPYHPVRINNTWTFPRDIAKPSMRNTPAVYTFVLQQGGAHTMRINGVEAVTLGHNYTDNEVVSHAYFGTSKIVEDLQKMDGWEDGQVEIRSGFLRDPATGLVCGIRGNGPLPLGA